MAASLAVLLLALTGGVALAASQRAAVRELEARFDNRAQAGAAVVSVFASDLLERQRDLAALWLSGDHPETRVRDLATALGARGAILLDAGGTPLASEPRRTSPLAVDLLSAYPHLAEAAAGRRAVSPVISAASLGVPAVAYAVPFQAATGRRVVAVAQDIGAGPLRGYLDETQVLEGSRVLVVDGTGAVVATSSAVGADGGTLASAVPALAAAVGSARKAAGTLDDGGVQRWTVQPVPGTPWRLVMAVPRAVLLEPLSGASRWLPWVALLVLTAAAAAGLAAGARLAASRDRLDVIAHVDELTGLVTRRRGVALLHDLAAQPPLSVLLVDVDRFKRINDTFGHTGGDTALQHVAAALRAAVRGGDVVVRWGGEEFLVVLPGADAATAAVVAERVRAAVADTEVSVGSGGDLLRLTVSVGAATAGQAGGGVDALVHVADRAMYRAKAEGRDCVRTAVLPQSDRVPAQPRPLDESPLAPAP